VTRNGRETRVACPHCQNVTEFPLPADMDERHSARGRDDGPGPGIPNIVIIQAPPAVVQAPPAAQRPIIIQRPAPIIQQRTVVVRRGGMSFIPYLVVFILLSVGVSTYIRMRAAARSVESSVEKAVDKGHEGEKKPPGKH
jgi:hypothetical protein